MEGKVEGAGKDDDAHVTVGEDATAVVDGLVGSDCSSTISVCTYELALDWFSKRYYQRQ